MGLQEELLPHFCSLIYSKLYGEETTPSEPKLPPLKDHKAIRQLQPSNQISPWKTQANTKHGWLRLLGWGHRCPSEGAQAPSDCAQG